jgi:hypothetical protein
MGVWARRARAASERRGGAQMRNAPPNDHLDLVHHFNRLRHRVDISPVDQHHARIVLVRHREAVRHNDVVVLNPSHECAHHAVLPLLSSLVVVENRQHHQRVHAGFNYRLVVQVKSHDAELSFLHATKFATKVRPLTSR